MADDLRRSIIIQPEDEQTIRQIMEELGISRSAAIRLIVRDWKRTNDRYSITERGRQLLGSDSSK